MKNVFGILVLILLPLTLAIIATIIGIDLMKVFGWLGDEIGFVFVMVLWTIVLLNLTDFFICFGVIYSC